MMSGKFGGYRSGREEYLKIWGRGTLMKRNHFSHLPQPLPDHLESCAAACTGFWNPGLFRAHEPETMSFEAAVWAGGLAASGEQSMNEGGGPDTRGRQYSGGEQRGFFPVTVRGHKTPIQVTTGGPAWLTHGGWNSVSVSKRAGNDTCAQSSPIPVSSLSLEM